MNRYPILCPKHAIVSLQQKIKPKIIYIVSEECQQCKEENKK